MSLCFLVTFHRFTNKFLPPLFIHSEAGSTSLVNQLTNYSGNQADNREAQKLCQGRASDPNHPRIAMVREPAARLKSAVEEVQRLHAVRLARWHSRPTYIRIDIAHPEHSIRRLDAFLDDYFRGRLGNWDGGLPHHVISSALHLHETVVVLQKHVTLLGALEYQELFLQAVSKNLGIHNNYTLLKENVSKEVERKNANKRNYGTRDRLGQQRTTGRRFRRNTTRPIAPPGRTPIPKKDTALAGKPGRGPLNRIYPHRQLQTAAASKTTRIQANKTNEILFQKHVQAMAAVLFEEDYICFGYPLPEDIPASIRKLDQVYQNHQTTVDRIPPNCSKRYIIPED